MKKQRGNWLTLIQKNVSDDSFLKLIKRGENIFSKVLSLALLTVIVVSIYDLIRILCSDLLSEPVGFFEKTIIEIFSLFLNVLIALELLENITVYLKKHVVQVELVIATSLIAVARKIIIFDFSKFDKGDNGYFYLASLALAILALSVSYWMVKRINPRD
ncbi:MAG: phosphate-starvation-inducible PsiE family protein [Microcystaceae cyanobacterium]